MKNILVESQKINEENYYNGQFSITRFTARFSLNEDCITTIPALLTKFKEAKVKPNEIMVFNESLLVIFYPRMPTILNNKEDWLQLNNDFYEYVQQLGHEGLHVSDDSMYEEPERMFSTLAGDQVMCKPRWSTNHFGVTKDREIGVKYIN